MPFGQTRYHNVRIIVVSAGVSNRIEKLADMFFGDTVMNVLKIAMFSGSAFLMVGCVSNSELQAVKLEALQASSDANRTAEEALLEAREAKRIAQEANSRAVRSEEMLNRGFKRSMYK